MAGWWKDTRGVAASNKFTPTSSIVHTGINTCCWACWLTSIMVLYEMQNKVKTRTATLWQMWVGKRVWCSLLSCIKFWSCVTYTCQLDAVCVCHAACTKGYFDSKCKAFIRDRWFSKLNQDSIGNMQATRWVSDPHPSRDFLTGRHQFSSHQVLDPFTCTWAYRYVVA